MESKRISVLILICSLLICPVFATTFLGVDFAENTVIEGTKNFAKGTQGSFLDFNLFCGDKIGFAMNFDLGIVHNEFEKFKSPDGTWHSAYYRPFDYGIGVGASLFLGCGGFVYDADSLKVLLSGGPYLSFDFLNYNEAMAKSFYLGCGGQFSTNCMYFLKDFFYLSGQVDLKLGYDLLEEMIQFCVIPKIGVGFKI